ncbi:MAG TPA: uroporphyrinogen-III C-methyltransferase [Gemmatimonadaceae bacterium]|nr:uroporphyrinogen-III C-methyltransferase [Gemmatimonadaceae bacterium]
MSARGIVYLVGAGPGDPGLLTVRARELLDDCDAIVHDALVNADILPAPGSSRKEAPELHFVGKRGGAPSTPQEAITALLVELARAGKRVVRLKGGDPFVFGRGSEEAQALAAAGIPFEVVPGVTAGIAASAYAGIPVTHRGVSTSVTFVTGHEDPAKGESDTDWSALARAGGTLVLYMGVARLAPIMDALRAGGRPGSTPAAVVEWGTYPRQRTVTATVDTIAERAAAEGISAPAITIVGGVVALREEIAWWERRPLAGRRVIVTRARDQASVLVARLRALGAEVIEAPAIRVERVHGADVEHALGALGSFDWVVFTSQNAVVHFWEALRARGRDARAFAGARVAAVGPATADALIACGISADVLPERFVAAELPAAMAAQGALTGARVLFPRGASARDTVPAALREMGATVLEACVYRTVPGDASDGEGTTLRAETQADLVTFTSSSTVRNYVERVGREHATRIPAVSIGPVTSATAREMGIPLHAEASEATIDALVDAVVRVLRRDGGDA